LEISDTGYAPSTLARAAILGVQSQETWAFQAREDRDLSLYVRDLPHNLSQPMAAWQTRELAPGDELRQIEDDPAYTADFTCKLYEIHLSLADRVAETLALRGVTRRWTLAAVREWCRLRFCVRLTG